jgi:ankyrin repeat protein
MRMKLTAVEKKLTDEVIEALHGVPLAIEQASAYLHFHPSLTTSVLKSFLAKLSSPSMQADILAKIPKRSIWFYEKHRSVIHTFSLLKASVARNNGDALNILLISAFLAQGEIPLLFLTQAATSDSLSPMMARMLATYNKLQVPPSEALIWLQRISTDETIYYRALETLEQFCCIKRRLAPSNSTYISYSIHNAIRNWCQITLNLEEQAEWTVLAAFQLSQCLQLDNVFVFSHQIYSRHVGHVNSVILDHKYDNLVRYADGLYWWQGFMIACVWARFYQRQRRFDLASGLVKVIIDYEKAYDNKWPSQRESLKTLHLQATIFWEEGDFSKAIECYINLLQQCETHLGHFDNMTATISQELKIVQYRSKRQQQDWQMASCITEPDRPLHREEEREDDYTSSGRETFGLQRFMQRYTDPTVAGFTLYEGASTGDEVQVLSVLKKGANIEAKDINGQTALVAATLAGHKNMVQMLLEKGANIEAKGRNGQTALVAAALEGYKDIVQMLLEKGAKIEAKDIDGLTALIAATLPGRKDIVQSLLEKGANIEAKDNAGLTALITATLRGHKDIVKTLLEKGADINAKDDDGKTALIAATLERHEDIVQILLEKGADIEAKGKNGETVLFAAARGGHKDIVQMLLKKGADINAKDDDGRTALDKAAAIREKAMMKMLKKKGARVGGHENRTWNKVRSLLD